MKFFNRTENNLYASMGDLTDGCYPITNYGIWHSGIHIYFSYVNDEILKNPIAGKIVAANFNEKKDWHYIVIENDIKFPDKKKGSVSGFHCYNLISNIKAKMPYDDIIEKEQPINTEVLSKLVNIPFYINIETKLPKNTCKDKDNYKIFNISLNRTNSQPIFDPEFHVGGYSNLTEISKTDTVRKDTEIKVNNKIVGKLKYDISIDSTDFVDLDIKEKKICFSGSDIVLDDNLPKGYIIIGRKTISDKGNIQFENKSLLNFWIEKTTNIKSYPGFGLVVNKKLPIWNKILEGLNDDRKKELKALLESENKEYIFVLDSDKCIFPFIKDDNKDKTSYKIKDKNGEIVNKFLLTKTEYKLIKNLLVGFFKNNDFYHTCSEVWEENQFSYDQMEKIDIANEYNNFFDGVKIIDINDNPVSNYNKTKTNLISPYYCKAQLYCFLQTKFNGSVSVDNIYKKLIYISDPYSLYSFSDTEVIDDFPCSECKNIAPENMIFTNVEEVLQAIKEKRNYIWLKNDQNFVYVNKQVYTKLKIKVIKNNIKKGQYISVGEKIGFPFWKKYPEENEIPSDRPYIDYALFFTNDITTQNNKLEKIEIKENEKCYKEVKSYTENKIKIFLPPHCTEIDYSFIGDNKEYIKLNSITYEVYVYPTYVSNKKIKSDTANLLFYNSNCKVEIKNNIITSITPKFLEEEKTLIKLIANEVFLLMKTKNLTLTTDGDGNQVYKYLYKKDYNVYVKNDISLAKTCKFLNTFDEKINYGFSLIPKGGYSEIIASTSIEDKTINGSIYNGFIINNELYYVSKEIVEKSKTNVLSEFMENAKTLNFGKNPIVKSSICPENDLLIQEEFCKQNIKELRKALRTDLEKENKELIDYIYTDKKDAGFYIYDTSKKYPQLLDVYLKKIICKHPLEFDFKKIKSEDICKKRGLPPLDEEKASDIYAGLKSADSSIFANNSFYFVCAPYFYNKMEELGLMFTNPYQDVKTYSRLGGKNDPLYEFKINPGFAPCCQTKGKNGKFIYERDINGQTWYFATLNNPYGYSNGYFKKTSFHTGIDYPGTNDDNVKYAPIMALIRGRIWACTSFKGDVRESNTNGGYGRCMIIKGDNDYLYLLGHLQDFAGHKAGDYFSPGEIIAHAGNTGNSDAQHLHLELIECKIGMDLIKDRSRVLNMQYNQLHENDGGAKGNKNSYLSFTSKKETSNSYYTNSNSWKEFRLNPITGEKQ